MARIPDFVVSRGLLPGAACEALIAEAVREASPEDGSQSSSDRIVTIWQVEHPPGSPILRRVERCFRSTNPWGLAIRGVCDPFWIQCYPVRGYTASHVDVDLNDELHPKVTLIVPLVKRRSWAGGELWINGRKVRGLDRGDGVLFPSFLPHLVTRVRRGRRWVLAAWASGPPLR